MSLTQIQTIFVNYIITHQILLIPFFLGGDIPLDGLRMSLPDKQRGKTFYFNLQGLR